MVGVEGKKEQAQGSYNSAISYADVAARVQSRTVVVLLVVYKTVLQLMYLVEYSILNLYNLSAIA